MADPVRRLHPILIMDALTISAASGMRSRMDSLEMLANNLANVSTTGYKTDREFYSLYVSAEAEPSADGTASTLPVVERPWTDFGAGTLRVTNNPLDVALCGRGMLAVDGPSGPLYTRNGSLRVGADGTLLAAEGFPVRAAGGGHIKLGAGQPVEILADGTVRQGGRTVGQLELAEPNQGSLSKQGNAYFRMAGTRAAPAASTTVAQGRLEDSNVAPAESTVRLVSLMRQFEMLQKAISLGADMNRHAVEELARPGS